MTAPGNGINIFWFRRDLRLDDNTGLYYALQDKTPVLPIFIFDRHILDKLPARTDARVHFIHQTLECMNNELKKVGSSLLVLHDTPLNAFSTILSTYNVKAVYTNRDYEPYARQRDVLIHDFLKEKGIAFYTFKDQVIFEKKEILNDFGEPYKVFTPYKNRWISLFRERLSEFFDLTPATAGFHQTAPLPLPSLQSIGFSHSTVTIPKLELNNSQVSNYDITRDFPGMAGTTRLGIHLRHGTLSIRKAVQLASQLNNTWLNELVWREFYQTILFHFPEVVNRSFKSKYDNIPWRNNEEEFERWCEGTTGYPIVDAGMRELNATGFMHNRVRMITASFLTKHLLIDWRWGEAYFAQKLLDYDLASNNGGWQWAAGTGTDAQPYFRVFNPAAQADKFDKDKVYIRKWVVEYDSKNYPKPIVDHKFARQRAIEIYKQALS